VILTEQVEQQTCQPELKHVSVVRRSEITPLTGQFEYTQCENRCKNTKSTLKSRWVHSNFEWRNRPLKCPLNLIKWRMKCFYHIKCNKNYFNQCQCISKSSTGD